MQQKQGWNGWVWIRFFHNRMKLQFKICVLKIKGRMPFAPTGLGYLMHDGKWLKKHPIINSIQQSSNFYPQISIFNTNMYL
jgi:hypothetical protein